MKSFNNFLNENEASRDRAVNEFLKIVDTMIDRVEANERKEFVKDSLKVYFYTSTSSFTLKNNQIDKQTKQMIGLCLNVIAKDGLKEDYMGDLGYSFLTLKLLTRKFVDDYKPFMRNDDKNHRVFLEFYVNDSYDIVCWTTSDEMADQYLITNPTDLHEFKGDKIFEPWKGSIQGKKFGL